MADPSSNIFQPTISKKLSKPPQKHPKNPHKKQKYAEIKIIYDQNTYPLVI
jgi:hypothetical protein